MTERDVFLQSVNQIAEMVVEARKLTMGEFQKWHDECLENAPEQVRGFMEKIFIVIANCL